MARRLVLAMILVSTSLVVWVPMTARANLFGPAIGGCPDWCYNENNHPRIFYSASVNSAWVAALENARTTLNATDINATTVGTHADSDWANYVQNYGDNGNYAQTICVDWNGDICHHYHEQYNTFYGSYTSVQKQSLGCHEFGHSLGLNHYGSHQFAQSCMEEPHFHVVYNDHDRSHINGYY